MLKSVKSNQFKRDAKRFKKQGKDTTKLDEVISLLINEQKLPEIYKDHKLTGGQWKDYRDCHIDPDWVLIYKIDGNVLKLHRMDTHQMFRKKFKQQILVTLLKTKGK